MSNRNWIELPRSEGEASRQAHCDLPAGTYEREMGRDGFFGPATHLYHAHPPTGWTAFEGPLRPRAFDALAARRRERRSLQGGAAAVQCQREDAHLVRRIGPCSIWRAMPTATNCSSSTRAKAICSAISAT